ncbi:MAG: cyclic nucleotide-binding domain-containing protein [Bacteroidota bacterium]
MSLKAPIAQFFETDFPLNKEGLEELLGSFKMRHISKGRILLNEGEQEQSLRFLNRGLIREYYISNKKEININFYTRPQFITDFSSFMHSHATRKNQESLSELELLELGKEKFMALLEKYSCGKSFINLTFQKLLQQKELFEYNRATKEAEQLYKELQIYKAQWLQQIPQYHIASYLGVTPETLSRIRKRIS